MMTHTTEQRGEARATQGRAATGPERSSDASSQVATKPEPSRLTRNNSRRRPLPTDFSARVDLVLTWATESMPQPHLAAQQAVRFQAEDSATTGCTALTPAQFDSRLDAISASHPGSESLRIARQVVQDAVASDSDVSVAELLRVTLGTRATRWAAAQSGWAEDEDDRTSAWLAGLAATGFSSSNLPVGT